MAENNIINLFVPCQMDLFQPSTVYSVITVLERLGIRCQYYEEQTCCGKRFYMEGESEYARNLGVQILDNYSIHQPFVVPDCSCAGYIKKYFKKLLENTHTPTDLSTFTQNVYELCDYLVTVKHITTLNNIFNHRVFYFKSCASRTLYPQTDAPEILLKNTKGLDLLTNETIQGCCGANGKFAQLNPEVVESMTGDILNKVYNMGAEYITSTDIHCLQHFDAYKEAHNIGIEIIHIADILKGE